MTADPRRFFDCHVKPNYEEWESSRLDERRAMNAVASANIMAAYALHYWNERDVNNVYGLPSKQESKYRRRLVETECADFSIIQDVAEAHKHLELDRSPRQLTSSGQTKGGSLGWGKGGYGEGVYGGGPQLVVTLNNGTQRPLLSVMRNVIEMWERLLANWGI